MNFPSGTVAEIMAGEYLDHAPGLDRWFCHDGSTVFMAADAENNCVQYASFLVRPCDRSNCAVKSGSENFPSPGETRDLSCGCRVIGIPIPADLTDDNAAKELKGLMRSARQKMAGVN